MCSSLPYAELADGLCSHSQSERVVVVLKAESWYPLPRVKGRPSVNETQNRALLYAKSRQIAVLVKSHLETQRETESSVKRSHTQVS